LLPFGPVRSGHLDAGAPSSEDRGVELGVRVHVRDVDTPDDLADVTAPPPVEREDLLATEHELYLVDAVLWTPADSPCVPVLGRRVELTLA
jgi:hypothetical protein